ncbi:MAG: isocitrate lyase/phosphoenolpyruvate mutase family protein, partial [Acidimicrobiales bacterium]
RFLRLHTGPEPLVMPNPWDVGSARLLAHLGFPALATTSSGFAGTLGRLDGNVTREEALAHGAAIAAATDLPVNGDLENGFADAPDEVADTITAAIAAGLAGGSIEDYTGRSDEPIYERSVAVARIAAAAAAAHAGPARFVLTARAENFLHDRPDLADTIERLQAFQEAGADVLYAPGLRDLTQIRTVVRAVDRPVNVLVLPGGPAVAELAEAGVRRISVGGAFSYVAAGAVAAAARELLEHGTTEFMPQVVDGARVARQAYR